MARGLRMWMRTLEWNRCWPVFQNDLGWKRHKGNYTRSWGWNVRTRKMTRFICRRCNMEFTSDDNIMKLSQHIIDKHHGKMYLPYEMIKNDFKIVDEESWVSQKILKKIIKQSLIWWYSLFIVTIIVIVGAHMYYERKRIRNMTWDQTAKTTMIYNICTVKRNTLPGISRRGWLLIYHGKVRNLIFRCFIR